MSPNKKLNVQASATFDQSGRAFHAIKPPESSGNDQARHPTFCFCCIDPDYSVRQCDVNQQKGFANRLIELSSLTWGQIFRTGRHQLGSEPVDRESLRVPIPDHVKPDVKLQAFRFHDLKGRMIGYRDVTDRRLFHVLWLDRDHDVF